MSAFQKRIGQSVHRFEDQRLVTGSGKFTDDLRFVGEAYAAIVRSPHAHARILSIDTAAAEAAEGVLAVYTGVDLEADGVGPIPYFATITAPNGQAMDAPPCHGFARDTVRHVGEPVAMVVAVSLGLARAAADLVSIDYHPIQATTDVSKAVDELAPQLWSNAPGNVVGQYIVGDEKAVTDAIAISAHVVRLTVTNNRVIVFPLEPRTSIGAYDADKDELNLHCGSQAAHLSRNLLSKALGISEDRLHLFVGDVGGGFGSKIVPYREDLLVLFAARRLRRPVRWCAERTESFLSDTQGRDQLATMTLALENDGRILAYHADVLGNMGAYLSPFGSPIATTTGHRVISGVYDIPNLYLKFRSVLTNTVPTGPYRGAGRPEVIYRLERLLDVAAMELGLGPLEIRRRNLIRPEQMPYRNAAGWTYDSGNFGELLDRALRLSDWDGFPSRQRQSQGLGLLRGRGVACHIDTTSGIDLAETATLRLHADGTVELLSGTQAIGQGLATAYAQIVADHLHIAPFRVRVVQGDTRRVPSGGGTYGSRSLYLGGSAARAVSQTLASRLINLAAEMFAVAPGDLVIDDGHISVAGSNSAISFGELAARQPERCITCRETVEAPYTFPNGCYVTEVEIDPATGETKVVRMTALDDVGQVINPMIVHGQAHGGLAQGIGQALWEHAQYDPASGQLMSGSLMDYALPRADDLPNFEIANDESWPTSTNPLGAKGAGESGAVGAPPAIVSAVVDALSPFGVRHLDMPLTSEKIWRAIHRPASSQ